MTDDDQALQGLSDEEKLSKIIAEELSVSETEVVPEARFKEDLNADSLDLVEVIMRLEEVFGVTIADNDADKIKTMADALDFIKKHKNGS